METYRDQYVTLFKNGKNVVVLGVSVDADTTQAAWMREKEFPFVFASDSGGRVGQLYGAYDAKNSMDNRSLFVIGPDGKIGYVVKPFNVMSAPAYTDLGAAVERLLPKPVGGGTP